MTDQEILTECASDLAKIGIYFTNEEIVSKAQDNDISYKRKAVVLWCLNKELTLKRIAKLVGRKNHTTISSLRESARNLSDNDPKFKHLFRIMAEETISQRIQFHAEQISLLTAQLNNIK